MHIDEVETPAVLIDLDKVEANLTDAQAYADAKGLPLRPHVKTHKLPEFARWQMSLGAIGITCQKIGEAEAMAVGGLTDIFLPYNIVGAAKLDRLALLNARVTLAVTADNPATVEGYAKKFGRDTPLKVLVECDTGAERCGVQTFEEAVDLAKMIDAAPGLTFGGLMTYPPRGGTHSADQWLKNAKVALEEAGLPPATISSGGTPDLMRAGEATVTTEYRPGTYIYGDCMQVGFGHGSLDRCALTVKATIVSRPTPTRAVIDAGSKALAADALPAPHGGHGHIVEFPDAVITGLSEEHGVLDLTLCKVKPSVGTTVRVIPNHACVVTNLFDEVHLIRDQHVERKAQITSRGRLW